MGNLEMPRANAALSLKRRHLMRVDDAKPNLTCEARCTGNQCPSRRQWVGTRNWQKIGGRCVGLLLVDAQNPGCWQEVKFGPPAPEGVH